MFNTTTPVIDVLCDSEPNEDEKVVVKSRRHYSKDLRERIIYQSRVLGKSTSEISVDLDISLRVVQHTIQLWNEIGDVVRDPKEYSRRGRPRLMDSVACNVRDTTSWELLGTNPHAQYLLRLLDHRPDLYLDEIAVDLTETLGLSPSLSTIHRTLKLLGISTKKVCLLYYCEYSLTKLVNSFPK